MIADEHADLPTVRAILAMHGIQPEPEELDHLVASYQGVRTLVESLYTVPGVRYEDPAITFDPRR